MKILVPIENFIKEINIIIDGVDFSMMMNGFAADIYHLVQIISPDPEDRIDRGESIPYWEMVRKINTIAPHGYVNCCLIPKVKMLEEGLRLYKTVGKERIIQNDSEGYLIGALIAFNNWKKEGIEIEQKRYGMNWGSATDYNKWNPTEGLISTLPITEYRSKAEKIVDKIISNLKDREGIGNEFEHINNVTQQKIKDAWVNIVMDE